MGKVKVYKSIADYIVYLKEKYGVGVSLFSFNESVVTLFKKLKIKNASQDHLATIHTIRRVFFFVAQKTNPGFCFLVLHVKNWQHRLAIFAHRCSYTKDRGFIAGKICHQNHFVIRFGSAVSRIIFPAKKDVALAVYN